jgi:predicted DNA-binding protein
VSQKPLNEVGGETRPVATRILPEHMAKVIELASAAGQTRSEFIRAAIADAIEDAEGQQ